MCLILVDFPLLLPQLPSYPYYTPIITPTHTLLRPLDQLLLSLQSLSML